MSIMSMARTSMYVYFWILMTTLKHWVVKCDKLEGYSFPVYNTTSCPRNQSEWRNRSSDLNCTESNGYMCIPNENITQLVEFCYRYPRIPIEKSICLILKKTTSLVEAYSCKQFRNGCPDKLYWSNEVFKYQSCLSIGNGCFLAEPPCNEQGITTIGPTETKSTAVTGDIDENNTWVWVLVMGVFMLFFLIAACVPVIIIRRGKQKTFVVAKLHKRKDDIQTSSHSLKERELNAMERIPFIEFEGERRECEETQGEKDREQKKLGEEKSDDNALSDCIMDEQDDTLGLSIDETSKMADSSLEDISKEEYSSLNKDVSSGINSYLKQQGDGDRISSEKHEIVGIRLDGYEVWKTEISEKYKQLSNEERAALFLLLCSNDNTFILESTDTFTTRVLEICGTKLILKSITESIQTLQSKGFVFIKDKKVTFASDGVQDETMFDYLHTCWKRRKTDFQEMVMFKDIRKRKNCLFCPFIEGQLLKVSLESSVKYFRSQSYRKGKFVRCFTLKEYRRTFGTYASYKEILTRIISKLGKDILIYDILDDKPLHSTISRQLKIPEEILQWDLDARRRYLEYLKKGKTPIYRARAMIVGCAGAGKTTLLERLQKKSKEDIQKIKSTVGLEVHNDIFVVLEKEGKLKVAVRKCEAAIHIEENVPINDAETIEKKRLLSILDFGGQCMYYACHQIYLSKRAFYILVIDMSKNLEDVIDEELCDQKDTMFSKWSNRDYLLFWLKSVNCYCGSEAPVILVATHAEEKTEKEKTEYYQRLIESFPVSSTIKTHLSSDRYFTLSLKEHDRASVESLAELEKNIVEVLKSQTHWGEEIPLDWAIFEKFISEKKETKLQKVDKLKESFDEVLLLSRREFKDLLRFYHDIGVILYFSFKTPRRKLEELVHILTENRIYDCHLHFGSETVILDIQWFVNSFKYVMTDSKQASFNKVIDAAPNRDSLDILTTTGEISGTFLKSIWTVTKNQSAVEYKDDMMKYMEGLGLMAIEEKSDICFIPSMNRMKVPEHVKSKIHSHPNKSPTLYIRFPVLPVFLFYRLIVLCLMEGWKPLIDGRKCIYIDTAMFYYEEHVLVLGVSESFIQLLLYNDDDQTQEISIHGAFIYVKKEVIEMLSSLTETFNSDLHYEVGYSCTPTEFGKELDNTFITENDLFKYIGRKCPLHAHAEDHDVEDLRGFLHIMKFLPI